MKSQIEGFIWASLLEVIILGTGRRKETQRGYLVTRSLEIGPGDWMFRGRSAVHTLTHSSWSRCSGIRAEYLTFKLSLGKSCYQVTLTVFLSFIRYLGFIVNSINTILGGFTGLFTFQLYHSKAGFASEVIPMLNTKRR